MPIDINAIHERLNNELEYFCDRAPILIKTKEGGELLKFKMNKAQRYIDMRLNEQKLARGWVRAIVVKGRQQGASTYINVRYYHRTTRRKGTSTFILSHEGNTTTKLFGMVETFQDNINPAIRPEEGKRNTRQLTFPKLGSEYAAGTAGNEQVGRGGTAQLFHGSEAAYWEHAYAIQDGALKSIGLVPGTEIILESTANGPAGLFYDKFKMALKGKGDYILIFVPWFWQEEYEREDDGSALTEEEEKFIIAYFSKPFFEDINPIPLAKARRKLLWRRAEILDLSTGDNPKTGEAKFRTIYPSNPVEAFLSSNIGLVRLDAIMSARSSMLVDEVAPLVMGVDPAGDSDIADRTAIALRRGRHLQEVIIFDKMKPMELAGRLIKIIEKENVSMCFVDRGYGEGTIDRMRELGYGRKVQGIAFSEGALNNEMYLNKRSEILIEAANWINAGGVRIPDDDEVHAAFSCIPIDKETSNGLKYLPSKRELKKALGESAVFDIYDAVALTFSYPVKHDVENSGGFRKATEAEIRNGRSGGLKSMSRFRGGKKR